MSVTMSSVDTEKEEEFITLAKGIGSSFAILKLYVPDNVRSKYIEAVEMHNNNMEKNEFPDAGFDLFVVDNIEIPKGGKTMVDFGVKCQMKTYNWLGQFQISNGTPTGFYLYPRSSISKTPLMLANSVGIIDSGYRGCIKGVFRNINEFSFDENLPPQPDYFKLNKFDKIVQIVHPSMYRIFVHLVSSPDELDKTVRDSGGFGSTGYTASTQG